MYIGLLVLLTCSKVDTEDDCHDGEDGDLA
jgi:hypothetical protein